MAAEQRRNWRWARCRWDDPVAVQTTNTQITWGEPGKGTKSKVLKSISLNSAWRNQVRVLRR